MLFKGLSHKDNQLFPILIIGRSILSPEVALYMYYDLTNFLFINFLTTQHYETTFETY